MFDEVWVAVRRLQGMRDFWFLLVAGAFVAGWASWTSAVALVMWWYIGKLLGVWDGGEYI